MPMSPEQLKTIFGGEITKNTDVEVDFDKPIKGKYIAEVKDIGIKDVNTQNGLQTVVEMKMKIIEDLEDSEPSFNRYVNKTYWLSDSEYCTAQQSISRLGNDLYTMGVFDDEVIDMQEITKDNISKLINLNIKGRKVKLSLYKTDKGKQAVKIVVLEVAPINWAN